MLGVPRLNGERHATPDEPVLLTLVGSIAVAVAGVLVKKQRRDGEAPGVEGPEGVGPEGAEQGRRRRQ